ncbi:hypothetical protein AB4084_41645, partial [Lysobacter sp. 2RAB21]
MKSVAISLLALGVAFGACAQTPKAEPAPVVSGDKVPAASVPEQGADTAIDLDNVKIDIDSNMDGDS